LDNANKNVVTKGFQMHGETREQSAEECESWGARKYLFVLTVAWQDLGPNPVWIDLRYLKRVTNPWQYPDDIPFSKARNMLKFFPSPFRGSSWMYRALARLIICHLLDEVRMTVSSDREVAPTRHWLRILFYADARTRNESNSSAATQSYGDRI
jgi:hypothetical protein